MGNIIRIRKKVVTEELESLSQKMKEFNDDIEKTAEAKRMTLWYLTLSTFFLSSSVIAYVWIMTQRRERQVLFSIISLVAGQLILWMGRRAVNSFYNWRISRKRQGLDSLVAKKKSLLETVKETETFKVAKEILDKYDNEIPKISTAQHGGQYCPPFIQSMAVDASKIIDQLHSPLKSPYMKNSENITSEITPRKCQAARPRLKPIRPFQIESTTFLDKVVDYFFGDGPNQRYALICMSCHSHNGMALPAEYDYIAFVCFVCGHFNPARKFRPMKPQTLPCSTSCPVSETPLEKVSFITC
ncbi:hypothetical protein DICVIV_10753 [Dictyocaulus viviparus]|uniref:Endoplasmic reticulum junction formation protein lunapark n=1 Tax=Dictyocaulus viviparus TaxID=29172 RepID=A0A0D8XHP2_DICVI|nr:hypothetical protein DICVIV_10753 [Dictyocaulus viviparus]